MGRPRRPIAVAAAALAVGLIAGYLGGHLQGRTPPPLRPAAATSPPSRSRPRSDLLRPWARPEIDAPSSTVRRCSWASRSPISQTRRLPSGISGPCCRSAGCGPRPPPSGRAVRCRRARRRRSRSRPWRDPGVADRHLPRPRAVPPADLRSSSWSAHPTGRKRDHRAAGRVSRPRSGRLQPMPRPPTSSPGRAAGQSALAGDEQRRQQGDGSDRSLARRPTGPWPGRPSGGRRSRRPRAARARTPAPQRRSSGRPAPTRCRPTPRIAGRSTTARSRTGSAWPRRAAGPAR